MKDLLPLAKQVGATPTSSSLCVDTKCSREVQGIYNAIFALATCLFVTLSLSLSLSLSFSLSPSLSLSLPSSSSSLSLSLSRSLARSLSMCVWRDGERRAEGGGREETVPIRFVCTYWLDEISQTPKGGDQCVCVCVCVSKPFIKIHLLLTYIKHEN